MDTSLKIVIIGGILLILMILFSKKKRAVEMKISLICIACFFILAGVFGALEDIHSFAFSLRALFKILSQISFGMVLGIILTLRIFGQFKFTKRD